MAKGPVSAVKIPLLQPARFIMSIMKTSGQFSQEYPTFMLSYIGLPEEECPETDLLADIQGFRLSFEVDKKNPQEYTPVEFLFFMQPREELLDFSHCLEFSVPAPTEEANYIFQAIADLGRYVIIINTESYTYKALIDDETGDLLEATIDLRMLN